MYNGEKVAAIIAAAGRSERMQGVDKIFTMLGNRPVLSRTVYPFECHPFIDRIVVVINPDRVTPAEKLAANEKWRKVTDIIAGGERRQDSVMKAIARLENDVKWVIIHDGARPLVRLAQIDEGLDAAVETGAAVCAVPVTDTIKQVSAAGFIEATLDREKLFAVQTPQVFRYEIIRRAYDSAAQMSVTDDASLVENLGIRVKLFPGSYANIKITTPESLATAEMLWRRSGD
ncbi:2-C-methyl-D-erythritol 4-phosphate cytidylyltransferase [Dehalogenimonas formicexedens]|uniref:2-C-methyl-D-erythritol 4-phosphate cytidylyltransferase n=1 Tax=Dehalogenimonas formicexedens TaxID=1839801 RepID=UPI00096BA58D|nr:2-C-methyl-D-erythritol 4-phosphate cytidylyltransferase [Dehalogenimonas formicexedens]